MVAEVAGERDAVRVSAVGALAGSIVHDVFDVPLASVVLQPWMLKSISLRPKMPPFTLPRRMPKLIGALYWRLIDAVGDHRLGRGVSRRARRCWRGTALLRRAFAA
jgi:hypothetical protein